MKHVSLETAKKLKEVGWTQKEAAAFWATAPSNTSWMVGIGLLADESTKDEIRMLCTDEFISDIEEEAVDGCMSPDGAEFFAAPDAYELLEALPMSYEKDGHHFVLNISKGNTKGRTKEKPDEYISTWSIVYSDDDADLLDIQTPFWKYEAGQLAEAAADVYLQLKKANII